MSRKNVKPMEPIEVEVYDFSRDVALGICKCLWVEFEPINVAYERYKSNFGSIGDFLIALSRIGRCREQIMEELTQNA